MNQHEAITTLIKLIAHATEAHPHPALRDPRGQKDIAEAREAREALEVLGRAVGSRSKAHRILWALALLDERIAVRTARIQETTYI